MTEDKSGFGSKFDKGAVKQVLDFLFGKSEPAAKNGKQQPQQQQQPRQEGKFLDMRTEITSKETTQALTYYRLLEEQYSCEAAGVVADIMERLAISFKRMGRLEGVAILRQQLPKEEILLKGMAESLQQSMEG